MIKQRMRAPTRRRSAGGLIGYRQTTQACGAAAALQRRLGWPPPGAVRINNSTAHVLAGLGTIAGGLGITWRSAAGTLGHLSLGLVRPSGR